MAARFASTQAAGSFGPPAVPVTRSGQQTFGLICWTLQDAVQVHLPRTFSRIESTHESGNSLGHWNPGIVDGPPGSEGSIGLGEGLPGEGMPGMSGGVGIGIAGCNPSGSENIVGAEFTYA